MMNFLSKIKQIQRLNEQEFKYKITNTASWHYKYRDCSYIYISGFPKKITEGDLVIVFSQYGEIIDCRIIRDKKTGKNKGYGYICYEDQRNTALAVDNFNGIKLGGKIILVDYVEEYKLPKEFEETDNDEEKIKIIFIIIITKIMKKKEEFLKKKRI